MICVNFATGHYLKGQQRLKNSLNGHKTLMLSDYTSIGSPTHSESPYEFKLNSIEKALCFDDIILWCDSSLWRVGDLSKIENIIRTKGYFLEECGHWVNRWTNEATKKYFNLTDIERREGEGGLYMFSAGLVGLNKNSEIAMEFLKQWKQAASDGYFKGSHADHRHDQSCGSIVAQRLGMTYERGGSHMAYIGSGYSHPEPGVVFYLQGI